MRYLFLASSLYWAFQVLIGLLSAREDADALATLVMAALGVPVLAYLERVTQKH